MHRDRSSIVSSTDCGFLTPTYVAIPPRFAATVTKRMVTLLLAIVTVVTSLSAQSAPNVLGQRASREELTARIRQLQQQLGGTAKADEKSKVQAEISAISARLAEGDFRVGDRIVVIITQNDVRMDSVAVRDSLKVSLGAFPDVSLHGVLRSELDSYLTTFVARYLLNSRVRAIALSRISVVGAVGRPGYYYAVPDRPLSELVALAGGPVPEAKIGELEVKRGDLVVLSKKSAQRVLDEGRTLEQLDIQSGDEVKVPAKRKIPWQTIIQFFFLGMSLLFAVIQFLQFYYSRKNQ